MHACTTQLQMSVYVSCFIAPHAGQAETEQHLEGWYRQLAVMQVQTGMSDSGRRLAGTGNATLLPQPGADRKPPCGQHLSAPLCH